MHRWLIFTLLLAALMIPSAAGAQGGTKLESIRVDLWSEIDRPSMLVIHEFVVSQETSLPAEVIVRFPKDSNLVAVALETNGEFFNKDYTTPVQTGDWQTIKINVQSYEPHRVEYYQPLTMDGNKRQFQYQWFGDYYVKTFQVNILVPADVTDLITSPLLESTATSSDGLLISGSLTRNDLKPMNSFQFELDYQRTSDTLINPNASNNPVEALEPVGENTPGRVSIANLPWIIGGFGLALIGIALFSYWRSTQGQSTESQPRRRRHHKSAEPENGEAYCHECGTRAHPGDHFCRTCGSRLRLE